VKTSLGCNEKLLNECFNFNFNFNKGLEKTIKDFPYIK
jgi:hypothetical protein